MHETRNSIETSKGKVTYHHSVWGKPSLICWLVSCSLSSVKTDTVSFYSLIITQQCSIFSHVNK